MTVKCKPSDYSLRRWEERGGERSGGVLKRGTEEEEGRRKKRQGRLICTKPGCCLSVERIRHCWSLLLFHRPPPPATYFVFFSLYWFVLQFFILVLEEAMDTLNIFSSHLFVCSCQKQHFRQLMNVKKCISSQFISVLRNTLNKIFVNHGRGGIMN